jgi:hypothetical protein
LEEVPSSVDAWVSYSPARVEASNDRRKHLAQA